MNVLAYAARALRRELRGGDLLTLAAALVLAVAVMTAVGTLVNRVTAAVSANAAQIIGGDFGFAARQTIDPAISAAARAQGLAVTRMISFPSVVFHDDASQLADIKAVDGAYPLRGELRTTTDMAALAAQVTAAPRPGEAYADARLLDALGIAPGARIEFGNGTLRVSRRLHAEPDSGGELFQLAPRLLVNIADVRDTGLLGPGSRAQHRLMVAGTASQIARFRDEVREQGLSRGLRPISVENTQQAVRSAFARAQRFLSLAALLAVLLAGVATALAANRFALQRVDTVAILRCLGASQPRILAALCLQLLLLAVPACLLGAGLGLLAQAGLVEALGSLIPGRLPLPQAQPALAGVAIGIVLLLGFGLPPLLRLRNVPPMRVLNRSFATLPPISALVYVAGLLAAAVLVLLATGDVELSAIVLAGLGALAVVAVLTGLLMLRVLRLLQARLRGPWRLGLAALARRRALSVAQLVGLALSLCALLLLAAIGPELLAQWRAKMPSDTPNYFLLNVQETQRDAVLAALHELGVRAPSLEPFATGRLVAINGQPPARRDGWRDGDRGDDPGREPGNADRPLNMSWRHDFPPANTLVSGRYWAADSTAAEVSIEDGWAQRFGLALGDRITLGIGERELEVTVSNIRAADWDSFRVNFFVLLNAGALADAPHSLISSFYLPPGRSAALAQISRRFPNISMLDVDAILERVREVIDRVSQAVQLVLGFSLAAGVLVLLAALQATASERRFESAVLRTLGAGRKQLRAAVLIEFAALGTMAALLAIMAAAITGSVLAERSFGMSLSLPWATLIAGGGAGVVLAMAAGWLGTRSILSTPPGNALRAG